MCWHIHMAFKWEITWNMGPRVGSQPPYVLWWVQRVLKLVAAVTAGEWGWYSTGWKSLTREGAGDNRYKQPPRCLVTYLPLKSQAPLRSQAWVLLNDLQPLAVKKIITSEQIYAGFIMHNKLHRSETLSGTEDLQRMLCAVRGGFKWCRSLVWAFCLTGRTCEDWPCYSRNTRG